MMQRLTAYDRPFYGRADNLVLGPLNLAETVTAAGLTGSDAIDAHLITGGLPGILLRWPSGTSADDEPLSTSGGKPALYRVADSNLRLFLAILRDVYNLTQRGRPDAGYALFQRRWTAWRGRAVEPLIRTSLEQATVNGTLPWPDAQAVGGWWNRQFNPEIDLVGADRAPVASQIHFCGSVKWLGTPFDTHDLHRLREGAGHVPGFDTSLTGLIAVTRSGSDVPADALDLVWSPDDVVAAWRP